MNIDERIELAFDGENVDALSQIAVAHPSRADQISYLVAQLQRPPWTPADEVRCRASMAAMAAMPEGKL